MDDKNERIISDLVKSLDKNQIANLLKFIKIMQKDELVYMKTLLAALEQQLS